jgi:hypothetical protein
MYASASPGGFQQLSYYDAIRGELYRDFADGIGVTARTLTEGLFGILPDALNDRLLVKPGFPSSWKYAKLTVPDISVDFKQEQNISSYAVIQSYAKLLNLTLQVKALKDKISSVTINGKPAQWKWMQGMVGDPMISIAAGKQKNATIKIVWAGNEFESIKVKPTYQPGDKGNILLAKATCISIDDPQKAFENHLLTSRHISFQAGKTEKANTVFLELQQGEATWFEPVSFKTEAWVKIINLPLEIADDAEFSTIDLQPFFNDKVTQIFKNKYLSPRPQSPTLQIPWQGIGNWCYPLTDANINDSGTRVKAGTANLLYLDKIPFATPSAMGAKNIIYTSQWDNYPKEVTVPLTGKARHAYLLMAGSTNHQQSHFTNAKVIVTYADGSTDELPLINPTNWWPIEQDYLEDGFAFTTGAPRPYRLILKTGEFTKSFDKYSSIKGFSNRAIDGGAGTLIEMPMQKNKELKSMQLVTLANEVVVGLMSVTLVR